MKRQLLAFVLLVSALGVLAQDKNDPVANSEAVVTAGKARFTVLTPQMIRIQYSDSERFEDRATFGVVNRNLDVPHFTAETASGVLTITTDSLTLTYRVGQPITSTTVSRNLNVKFRMGGINYTWFPALKDVLNLKGTSRTLDQVCDDQWRHDLENGVISRAGWAVMDESPKTKRGDGGTTFALEPSDDGIAWAAEPVDPNAIDWYFMGYGHNYKDAVRDFTRIGGRIPLPPAYVFGYWYSRYWRYTTSDYLNILNDLAKYDVPIDVMIMDVDWHINGWTGWSWDKSLIPNPVGLLNTFHKNGLKVALNLHPHEGIAKNEDNYQTICKDLGLDYRKGETIPWKLEDKTFATSFFKNLIRVREKEGVDFWWLDWQQWATNPRMENLSETFWCNHVFFEDMRVNRPEVRPTIFHRWGGMGSHRYQLGFSGDSWATFGTLASQPAFTAKASNVGYGYWGHDLGGHIQIGDNDSDLYLRWMQYGVFSPIFRSHATNAGNIERRIWKFDNFPLLRAAVVKRYEMFPYIYTGARETYDTGISICRPLYYEYPEVDEAYRLENEYFFGNDMLISPIGERAGEDGYTTHKTWLPEGLWWDVAENRLKAGGMTFTGRYDQSQFPYFLRAGAIIPQYPATTRRVQVRPDTLRLIVVPGADGSGNLYEDAGNSQDYQTGAFSRIVFTQNRTDKGVTMTVGAANGTYAGMPTERTYVVEMLGMPSPKAVKLGGETMDAAQWKYDEATKLLVVTLPKTSLSQAQTLEVDADLAAEKGNVETYDVVYNADDHLFAVVMPNQATDAELTIVSECGEQVAKKRSRYASELTCSTVELSTGIYTCKLKAGGVEVNKEITLSR